MIGPAIHINDKQNLRKHEKMVRRQAKGAVNPNCKWAKSYAKRRTA